ncbi:MAG: sigma-54 dependent transcriptional regulator [Nitrospirota bacterium]|nr:sigma-54 dependent transcriptional regulator [Nitrospirota bacterium]
MKILTLDLDPNSLQQLQPVAVEMGLEMLTAYSVTDAARQIAQQHPDVLILDMDTQAALGYEAINGFGPAAREIPVIFLTRTHDPAPALDGRATAAITRPIAPDSFRAVLGQITRVHEHEVSPTTAAQMSDLGDYGTMLCHSATMRDVINMVDQVAATNITVLVRGESGTGKELISRSIFQRSLRHDKPFVKVLCAALPEGLLESELFGYERGAFTGAHKRKPGKFEFANHGTIFLDEIGEVPITLQSKLLQVLQDGEFVRLGGEQDVRVDVRIIAATNRDLEHMVKVGTFREDLFYRLNVVSITVPPLRDRIEEVPHLCDYFIEKFSRQYQRTFPRLSGATMDCFMSYPWPGNIRELENMIKQMVVLGDERTVLQKFEQYRKNGGTGLSTQQGTDPLDTPIGHNPNAVTGMHAPSRPVSPERELPATADPMIADPASYMGHETSLPPAPAMSSPTSTGTVMSGTSPSMTDPLGLMPIIHQGLAEGHLPLKEIGKRAAGMAEREAILRVLNHTRWNRRKAAQILDISYKALLYKIRDYGLNDD